MSDETPPSGWTLPRLRVDVHGDWYDDDVQVTHPGILANLRNSLKRDDQGWFIQTRARIPVEVEDTPWIVLRIEHRGDRLHVLLNDGDQADIDPSSISIGRGEVPYCTVKDGRFSARLTRAAAHQLLGLVELDRSSGTELLRLGDRTYPLRRTA
jgi:uncharacterized protein